MCVCVSTSQTIFLIVHSFQMQQVEDTRDVKLRTAADSTDCMNLLPFWSIAESDPPWQQQQHFSSLNCLSTYPCRLYVLVVAETRNSES